MTDEGLHFFVGSEKLLSLFNDISQVEGSFEAFLWGDQSATGHFPCFASFAEDSLSEWFFLESSDL